MADPLSITASIVGIIAATSQGIELLSNTIQNIRNAPESIKSIQTGIQQLKPLLTKLEFGIKEEPTELILSTEIRDALGTCNRACTEFNVSLTHWTRHSSGEKTSVLDNAKIGIFRQGRIRVLNEQLCQSIKILNVTLNTATFLKLSRQDDTAKDFGDQMLVQLECRLTKTIDQALRDRNAAIRFEDSIQPLDDAEEKEGLLGEMKRQKAMIDAVRRISEEALKASVSQRTKQKIHDVNSTDNSIALAGMINVKESEAKRDQDISKIYANGRSISIAGVANNIDINSMFANMRS
ncbi:uncharacterized protein B0J16DRAFT_305812 [Fusarium flagelliforme]|uniref:uncharacterized protein n=1 Tax=Fusarium flagelliforme TaxID=2675880 RepID=UPI001E8EE4E3|nr:uncharacterized protein B0J16DRAFT_305812 [Fusarium flagelliforme]KAH7186153.1 hypothetical protein B0J16DRAFT_305812 [Fusarium flagelliforme]